jgi:hypothetical protein
MLAAQSTTNPAVARLHRWPSAVAQSLTGTLGFIAERAADEVGVSTGAGVTLLTTTGRRITSVGTDGVAERLNALHDLYPVNPGAAAWLNSPTVCTTADVRRWPGWLREATDMGACSVLSAPLSTPQRLLGTLMVYAGASDAYRRSDEDMLARYARDAGILIDETQAAQLAVLPRDTDQTLIATSRAAARRPSRRSPPR